MKFKKTLFAILGVFSLTACQSNIETLNNDISHETKFGGIYINLTIDNFNKLGFAYGDSLDIKFTNGYELKDLPYYSGYYVDNLDPLLVGYPGYPYIRAGFNNGPDMWEVGKVSDVDKADIKLNQKAKYLDVQEALDIHYTDIQGDIPDEVFGNYRCVKQSNLKEGVLYRSASPVDNQHYRAAVVDRLIKYKVNTIINLSDDDSELKEHFKAPDFNSPYAKSIYDKGNIIALSMNMNFQSSVDGEQDEAPVLFREFNNAIFDQKLVQGMNFMVEKEPPYLVHCVEGKDRTGFVCMVIEALAGATYNEIIDDYMVTYDNYYGITKAKDSSKYEVIKGKNIDVMLKTIINDDSVDIKTANYKKEIKEYLIAKGMTQENINALESKLSKL